MNFFHKAARRLLRGTRDRIAHVKMGQTELQDELKKIEDRPNEEKDPGMWERQDSYNCKPI
jgi:hypothetical protein